MKRLLAAVFITLLLSVLTCPSGWAQATAQISGTVRDQSGAVLPGVEVTATQTDTGISRSTITNETGSYNMPNLVVGPYRLEAALPGFRTFAQTGIVLQVNGAPVINPVLEVGQVSEQIEVQANAALVETHSIGIGQVMETQRIVELPLNGRNVAELMLLSGGNVQVASPSGAGRNFPDRLVISAAGGVAQGTDYTLDGIRHIDWFDGLAMPLPFPDALAEFKVETSGLTAQHGRGSSVGAVTKSGTNEFHGDLFEFVRNDLFNARQYFAINHSTLKRSQYGGTLGGPIAKNKLFFFAGFQGTITRQDPANKQSYIPTAAMLAGDFTAFASPLCNVGRQITLKAPFVNNRVDPALFSKAALNITSRLPKTDDPCGKIVYGQPSHQDGQQIVNRMDYQLSNKHTLFGRYVWSHDTRPSGYVINPNNLLTLNSGSLNFAHSGTIGSTYLINPNMVNAFRLGFNRSNSNRTSPEVFDARDIGVKDAFTYFPHKGSFTVNNGFTVSSDADLTIRTTDYMLSDDVSLTQGTHQFAFGGTLEHSRTNSIDVGPGVGAYSFDGQATGLGLADFLTGRLALLSEGESNRYYARRNNISVYSQDVWKVKPRLTLNYGLRWAPSLPILDYRRPIVNVLHFDMDRYIQGVHSTVFPNAPAGIIFMGDSGFGLSGHDTFKAVYRNFEPRFGFAWDVTGDGRMSVRASYGLSYVDFPTQLRQGTAIGQPPWGNLTNVVTPVGGFDDPWQDFPGGMPFPTSFTKTTPFIPFGSYISQNYNMIPTYVQAWNLTIQKEVADTLVSISYLGNKSTHMWLMRPLNDGVFVPGVGDANGNCFLNGQAVNFKVAAGAACSTTNNTQARRALSLIDQTKGQGISTMGTQTTGGNQIYNGMILSVQRRPSHGFTVNGNYTWAHCIGDFAGRSTFGYSLNINETNLDPNNRRRDRGDCEFIDVRQNFNLTAVVETPKFAGHLLSTVASGWRLSGIYRKSTNLGGLVSVTSGFTSARTVTTGVDRALTGQTNQRPDQILANIYLDKSAGPNSQYLNPAAFAQPAPGTLGNMGRVNIDPPGTWQFDTSLSRIFRFHESQSLEFRAEAYNVLNSYRPGNPVTTLNSGTFGKIITALDPRIMQFALKYVF